MEKAAGETLKERISSRCQQLERRLVFGRPVVSLRTAEVGGESEVGSDGEPCFPSSRVQGVSGALEWSTEQESGSEL